MRDCLNFGRLANRFVVFKTTLRVDEVRSEDGVDERALPKSCLSNDDDVELETPLEELVLNLAGDGVESNVRRRPNFLYRWSSCHFSANASRSARRLLSSFETAYTFGLMDESLFSFATCKRRAQTAFTWNSVSKVNIHPS